MRIFYIHAEFECDGNIDKDYLESELEKSMGYSSDSLEVKNVKIRIFEDVVTNQTNQTKENK